MTTTTPAPAPRPARKADPLPEHLQPMLAELSDMPMIQTAYGFEYKWDGIRALAYLKDGKLRLESRNLLDITDQYPELQELASVLTGHTVLLDGEIIALDPDGTISFPSLQHRMHLVDRRLIQQRAAQTPVTYMIFDLLYLDGHSLLDQPYTERRAALERLDLAGPAWATPPWYQGHGEKLLEAAQQKRLEGIVAKRLDSVYEPGRRTGAWRKIKFVGRQEFVIGGWIPWQGQDQNMVGSLLVGYYDAPPPESGVLPPGRRLHYAGGVGTGFSDVSRRQLAQLLRQRATWECPFYEVDNPRAYFVRPELVAEIEFRGWSPDGKLRQAAFKGLRSDKDPWEVVREDQWGSPA